MSSTVDFPDGVTITRYCGPGDTPGPHRIRFEIHVGDACVRDVTPGELFSLACGIWYFTHYAERVAKNDASAGPSA